MTGLGTLFLWRFGDFYLGIVFDAFYAEGLLYLVNLPSFLEWVFVDLVLVAALVLAT
ncbi:hypothetical protein [Secundilactobacillus paracollinoides]|uniref:hypothetical protein n=1 Tax=Secundilactobacillus paracollinoides TaxID=240427 RepID=UPI0012E99E92|nr:hypothetical protein [Secundilactobacillus paracollinoides]